METSANSPRRHALVAGAGMGIGEGIARRLAADGYELTLCDRVAAKVVSLADELSDAGHPAAAEVIDITDPERLKELAASVLKRVGPEGLHAAVTSVGVFDDRRSLLETDLESFKRVLEINVVGAFLFSKTVAPLLAPGASMIHIGSINGTQAGAHLGGYKVSKAALNMMCRCLSLELARDPRRIRVNIVAPCWVDTPGERKVTVALGKPLMLDDPDAARFIPLGRKQEPSEIAATVSFLCSKEASMITGQIIYVDGGMSVR